MNSGNKKGSSGLYEPEQAISHYLEALLSEVDEFKPEPKPQEIEKPKPTLAEVVDFPTPVILPADMSVADSLSVCDEPKPDESQDEKPKVEEVSADDIHYEEGDLVPEWAAYPFQCLLFKVRGMTLAVPLVELNSIAEWNQETTTIPGQPDWHLGIYLHRDEQVVVVDTAQLIMPERFTRVDENRQQESHILIIGDGKWGLACDTLQRPATLTKEDIRWSKDRERRPWMAGTIIEKLCILLNVDALLKEVRHD